MGDRDTVRIRENVKTRGRIKLVLCLTYFWTTEP